MKHALLALAAALACAPRQPPRPTAPRGPQLYEAVLERFPADGERNACIDTPLRLRFREPVALGVTGKIRAFVAARPQFPVAWVEIGVAPYQRMIGGRRFTIDSPFVIGEGGREVTIRFENGALAPGEEQFIDIGEDMFVDSRGKPFGGTNRWHFRTRPTRPVAGGTLTVAADGSSDFCTVQGAVDAVPAGNTTPVTIALKNGHYREIVLIDGKSNLTLRGEDRRKTVIAYASGAVVNIENASDVVVENLTLHNLTPEGGGPAAALRVDPGDRVIVRRADLKSRQGTMLLSGRVYVSESHVEGNVDVVTGQGIAFFERCELKTVGRPGSAVLARNPLNRLGFIFYDSRFTADPGITGSFLARVDATQYPASNVAVIFCMLGPHLDPAGWLVTPPDAFTGELRLWEYDNRGLDTPFLNRAGRNPAARPLTAAAADRLRNKLNVLGGWDPGTLNASK
jgi:hypothetical protein